MSARYFVSRLAVAVVMAMGLGSAPALASLSHKFVSSFGSFTSVQGVAIDKSTGDVYVYDAGAGELLKYTAAGEPAEFTATKTNSITGVGVTGAGESEIAVDNSSGPAKGDIYVAHGANNISIYNTAGEKIGELTEESGKPWGYPCGVAVDSSGNVYVGLYGTHVNKYTPSANPATDADYGGSLYGVKEVCNLAADSAGDVYVDTIRPGSITRYEASQFNILETSAVGAQVDENGNTLAVDSTNDRVYVDERGQIAEFGGHGEPFDKPLGVFANEGAEGITESFGIAVNATSEGIYASDGKGHLSIFGPAVTVPTVVTGKVSNLTGSEATLGGSVNPEGLTVTGCQFEYGTTNAYGQSVPCPKSPGGGNAPVEETATLSGLQPGTNYHYRLVASNANGKSSSADRTLETEVFYPLGITGLPDGRVYEQVSPVFKNGNSYDSQHQFTLGLAAAGGDAVMYPMSGAVGAAYSGMITEYASTRTSQSGWQTVSTTPHALGEVSFVSGPVQMTPSSDFKRFLFSDANPFVADDPVRGTGFFQTSGVNIFLSEDPTVEPQWLGKPQIAEPLPSLGHVFEGYAITGASSSLDTVYFTYDGTLIGQDASRAPNVAMGQGPGRGTTPWGFYEWHDGQLVSAGVLPDGQVSAFGAVPPGFAGQSIFDRLVNLMQAEITVNNVSEDGSRAFFVSPDPDASKVTNPEGCEVQPPCTSEPPELYVREQAADGSRVSVLISSSELSGREGEAAADGVVGIPYPSRERNGGTDAFASPDSSHVFFASSDRLTQAAPADATAKMYDYDLETKTLTYLPGVSGAIGVTTRDGGEMLFENRSASPWQLELWRRGPNGGSVTPVTGLPGPSSVDLNAVHVSSDGSVFVFRTNAVIPGGFNNSGGTDQIYRYETSGGHLDCVSCPPKGIAPPGEARMSYNNADDSKESGYNSIPATTIENRGMSADGSRVFFDTPAPLVPQDMNGVRDVYEWEDGHIYLISSGVSNINSEILDNSESGGDVFFSTTSGLVPGDTDEAGDVYDARIPRLGDSPPIPTPCKGSVCQGSPSVPDLLGAPASATFSGVGNLTPPPEAKAKHKSAPTKKKARKTKKKVHKKKAGRKGKSAGSRTSHGKHGKGGMDHTGSRGQRNGRGK